MTNTLTHWFEEDIVIHVELIAHVHQSSTLDPNLSKEADWREVIILFLKQGGLPKDLGQAQQIKWRITHSTLIGNNLYKWTFSHPLLKCLGP